jgi:hypothetical protein
MAIRHHYTAMKYVSLLLLMSAMVFAQFAPSPTSWNCPFDVAAMTASRCVSMADVVGPVCTWSHTFTYADIDPLIGDRSYTVTHTMTPMPAPVGKAPWPGPLTITWRCSLPNAGNADCGGT